MKVVSLRISAIVHATEDSPKVNRAITNVCPAIGSSQPNVVHAKGHYGNKITTLVLTIKNPKAAESCLRDIWNMLSVLDKETIVSSLATRIDKSGTLFLRIDKQAALKEVMRLLDSDPVKITISFRIPRAKQHEVADDLQKFLTGISTGITTSVGGLH